MHQTFFELLKSSLARISNQLLLFSVAVILLLYFLPDIRLYTLAVYFVASAGYLFLAYIKIKRISGGNSKNT